MRLAEGQQFKLSLDDFANSGGSRSNHLDMRHDEEAGVLFVGQVANPYGDN